MTHKEFINKWHLTDSAFVSVLQLLTALDDLYLKYTPEQVLQLVNEFYNNADDIWNSLHQDPEFIVNAAANKLEEVLQDMEDEENSNKCDA